MLISMDEPTREEIREVEDEDQKEDEPAEMPEPTPPHREGGGGGFVRGLIWLIVLALIAWGGYTAYKNRGDVEDSDSSEGTATTTAATATGTPAQPTQ